MTFTPTFAAKALKGITDEFFTIVEMSPATFLRLAPPIASRINSYLRRQEISHAIDGGTPLETLPYLNLTIYEGQAYVEEHDGRHRALEFAARGATSIPVLVEFTEPNVALTPIKAIHPQAHDEDDEYPGLDEEDLDRKLRPIDLQKALLGIHKPSEWIIHLAPDE